MHENKPLFSNLFNAKNFLNDLFALKAYISEKFAVAEHTQKKSLALFDLVFAAIDATVNRDFLKSENNFNAINVFVTLAGEQNAALQYS